MKKRLSSLMRSLALGGLVACAVAKVLILFTASPVPDPASGRTEPSLFAPAVFKDWDYITPLQSWVLIVLTGATLISIAGWALAAFMERWPDAAGPRADEPPVPARRSFGRQGR